MPRQSDHAGAARPARDLRSRPFPAVALRTPEEQRQSLETIREWAEQEAVDAIEWYLRDKRLKRIGSRLIRGLTIVLAIAGTAVPLGGAAAGGPVQSWGYVLLVLAAGCKGFDYFFGLSAGWMRDITAAQSLRGALNTFQLAWTTELLGGARAHGGAPAGSDAPDAAAAPVASGGSDGSDGSPADPSAPLDPETVQRRMRLISGLIAAVHGQLESETAEWLADFASSEQRLREQTALPAAPAPAVPSAPSGPPAQSGPPAPSSPSAPSAPSAS